VSEFQAGPDHLVVVLRSADWRETARGGLSDVLIRSVVAAEIEARVSAGWRLISCTPVVTSYTETASGVLTNSGDVVADDVAVTLTYERGTQ
jgi:hypothetical protein